MGQVESRGWLWHRWMMSNGYRKLAGLQDLLLVQAWSVVVNLGIAGSGKRAGLG